MFSGFKKETIDFLYGIRHNNNKEWFEPHKKEYLEFVYNPLVELGAELAKPYVKKGMFHKVARIYQDAAFPPHLHYREKMWIYILYEAENWSKTPMLFSELSPDGLKCGFKISSPDAYVMENFRKRLDNDSENDDVFLKLVKKLKRKGVKFSGDEYKRKKPAKAQALEEFYQKKNLFATVELSGESLYSDELLKTLQDTLKATYPLVEYFREFLIREEVRTEETVQYASPVADKYGGFMW